MVYDVTRSLRRRSDRAIRFDGHLYDLGDPMLWYTSVWAFNSGGGLSKGFFSYGVQTGI